MNSLILNSHDWSDVIADRENSVSGMQIPKRWAAVLDGVSAGMIRRAGIRTMFGPGVHVSSHLMTSTIIAAMLRRPLIYLCWGVDYHTGLRRGIARMVLRAANVVLVNDSRTKAEVFRVAGVHAREVPYVVDTDFFSYAPMADREDFLFCPGSNDRDGDVLLALASRGHKVVWLNNSPSVTARYTGRDERLLQINHPTNEELRDLYRRCKAVVLPLTRDIHAAGQTTTLEGLASGCTVLISEGRTSEMFAQDGLVTTVCGAQVAAWEAAIADAVSTDAIDRTAGVLRAELIARDHGVHAVGALMREVVREAVER